MLVQSDLNLLFAYAYKNVGLVSLADYFCSTVQITSIITHIRSMWGWRCPGNRKGLSGGSRILNKGGSSITIKAHVACLLRESGGMPLQEDSDPLRSIVM